MTPRTASPWPKIIHRIWLDEDESPRFAEYLERLEALHPGWEIRTWRDSSEFDWIRNRPLFDQWFARDPYGRIPDILRYEILWRFGGVYIDTDFEPLKPLDPLLEDPRPFAAWENDRTMCTALLAAPPEHPAIDALIRGLPAHAAKNEHRTPNYATGPEWATSVWRGRDDVRRLPPMTFYPVGWWERHLLGGPYPEGTYAVHQWARGWGNDRVRRSSDEPRVVILVPWRAGDPHREAAWAKVYEHLERTGWPIYPGDTEGPFNRSAAINAAATKAGEWDAAVIVDADTIDDPKALEQAVAQALEVDGAVVPWSTRWKLNEQASRVAGRRPIQPGRDRDRRDPTKPRGVAPDKRGGAIVVSRGAWDAVGGFDEGFTEWGHEDRAFRLALEALAPGGLAEIDATCVHLWHPLASATRRGTPAGRERFAMYEAVRGSAPDMALLLRDLGRL